MRFFILFILLLFFSTKHLANADSLSLALKKAKADTNKVILLNSIGKQLWQNGEFDSALVYCLQAQTLSETLKYKKGIGDAYNSIGAIYRLKGDLKSALINFQNSIKYRTEIHDTKGVASSTKNMGSVYESQSNYPEALKHYFAALKLFESIDDKKGIANSHIGISNIYDYQQKYKEALAHGFMALKIQESLNDQKGLANSYIGIGVIYYNQNIQQLALTHFQNALNISQAINYKQGIAFSYNNIGNVYKSMGDLPKALGNYFTSLKIKEEMGDLDGVASSYINLGSIYISLNNLTEAKNNLTKAFTLSQELGNKENIKLVYGYRSRVDSFQNKFKEAYYNYYNYIAYRDSLLNEENTQKSIQTQLQYEFDKKETIAKAEQLKKDIITAEEKQKQKIILWSVLAGLTLVIIFAVFMVTRFRIISKQKRIIELKEQETQRKNDIISYQKDLVEEKQKEILESINYAKRIQYSLLAHSDFLKNHLPNHFVFFQPKDIVSGDFYWATKRDDKFYLAVCDSTGHGVPGAFMSLLSIGYLSEAINEKDILKPNEVFNYVRQRLIETISKEEQKDGFDGILLCFDFTNKKITYAGAHNSPVSVNHDVNELKTDKMPVGIGERKDLFSVYEINYTDKDTLYLFTDGYADQFGGPKGKKFKYKQLNELLLKVSKLPLNQQAEVIKKQFEDWKGNLEQVDDVCIIGIQLNSLFNA